MADAWIEIEELVVELDGEPSDASRVADELRAAVGDAARSLRPELLAQPAAHVERVVRAELVAALARRRGGSSWPL